MEAAMVGTPSELQLLPKKIYLNSEYGLKSWLLTQDHQRIVLLYPFTTSFFFVIGGTAASLNSIRTPYGRRRSRDLGYLHQTIFHIWHHHCFFLLVPVAPAVLGNFLIPLMIGAKDVAFAKLNVASWYPFALGGCVELYMMIFGAVRYGMDLHNPAQHALRQHKCNRRGHGNLHCRVFVHTDWAQLHCHHSPTACLGLNIVSPTVVHLVLLCDVHPLRSCHRLRLRACDVVSRSIHCK
jgi:hypothetical protein